MKYRVVGWTDWESDRVPESEGTIGFAERNAIIDDIVKHGYSFSGYDHQELDCCAPVLNDGRKRCYSQRGWGGVMAEARGMTGDYDYAAFSFDTCQGGKRPCDEFDPYSFEAEDELNEEFSVEVDEGIFKRAERSPFYLEDLESLRYIDKGDVLTLTCGEEKMTYLVEDIDRGRHTRRANLPYAISTKFRITVRGKRMPDGYRLEKKRRFVYFSVSGDFDTEEFISRVGVSPDAVLSRGDTLPGGKEVRGRTLLFGAREWTGDGQTAALCEVVRPFMEKLELMHALRDEWGLKYELALGREPMGNLYFAPSEVGRFICLSGTIHDAEYSVF